MVSSSRQYAVVVPIYRNPTILESLSLHCLLSVLSGVPLYLVQPSSLRFRKTGFHSVCLPDHHFSSLNSYARLMVDPLFYRLFCSYEYILLYQLDCLIFSDKVGEFCDLGYDYIAPPFLASPDKPWPLADQVGVGGFSLRHIASHLNTLEMISLDLDQKEQLEKLINDYNAEDVFWGTYASRINKNYTVAEVEVGLRFGFNGDPKPFLARLPNQKPLGCHHWQSSNYFWYYHRLLPFAPISKYFWLLLAYSAWVGKFLPVLPRLFILFVINKICCLKRIAFA